MEILWKYYRTAVVVSKLPPRDTLPVTSCHCPFFYFDVENETPYSSNSNPVPNCDIAIQYSVPTKTEVLGIAITTDTIIYDYEGAINVWKIGTGHPRYTEMSDENDVNWALRQCQNRWGVLFPIVKFRCTPPRELTISNQPDEDRIATWRQHDDAVEWQLFAGTSDTAMDVLAPVSVFDTSYQFPELLLDTTMVVGVRKACRYTTPAYDTVV